MSESHTRFERDDEGQNSRAWGSEMEEVKDKLKRSLSTKSQQSAITRKTNNMLKRFRAEPTFLLSKTVLLTKIRFSSVVEAFQEAAYPVVITNIEELPNWSEDKPSEILLDTTLLEDSTVVSLSDTVIPGDTEPWGDVKMKLSIVPDWDSTLRSWGLEACSEFAKYLIPVRGRASTLGLEISNFQIFKKRSSKISLSRAFCEEIGHNGERAVDAFKAANGFLSTKSASLGTAKLSLVWGEGRGAVRYSCENDTDISFKLLFQPIHIVSEHNRSEHTRHNPIIGFLKETFTRGYIPRSG